MINKITFTGPDDNTKIEDLIYILEKYPFVEFGILFCESNFGEERYPSVSWIKEISNYSNLNLSLHLCGKILKRLTVDLDETVFEEYPEILKFKRIQLNFSPYKVSENLSKILLKYPNEFIYQLSSVSQLNPLIENSIKDNVNFSILFDSSGGRGILSKWKRFVNYSVPCGYAGGLGPDNLIEEMNKINEISGDEKVSIDMETKIRTGKFFDFDKINKCIIDFTSINA